MVKGYQLTSPGAYPAAGSPNLKLEEGGNRVTFVNNSATAANIISISLDGTNDFIILTPGTYGWHRMVGHKEVTQFYVKGVGSAVLQVIVET